MRLELGDDPDRLWRQFPPKLRSQIRRPEKDGLVARTGGADQLDAFYALYAERMRELGTPVYPRRFFAGILDRFPDLSRLCCVYAGDRPVAAGLLIGFKDRLEIPWAASLTAFNRQSPNMLLYWQALRFGCEHGYRWFDFGRSTPGGPHHRFKAQWGTVPGSALLAVLAADTRAPARAQPPEPTVPARHPCLATAPPASDPGARAHPRPEPRVTNALGNPPLSMRTRLARATFWVVWSRGVVQGISLVSTLIVARLLTPDDYGLMALAVVWTGALGLVAEFGLGAALVQFRDLRDAELNACFWLITGLSILAYVALYAAAPTIATLFANDALSGFLRVVALAVPLVAVRIVPDSLLRKSSGWTRSRRRRSSRCLPPSRSSSGWLPAAPAPGHSPP